MQFKRLYKPLILIGLAFPSIASAQHEGSTLYVKAETGLRIRSLEQTNSRILTTIFKGDSVTLIYDSGINTMQVDGITGKMVNVKYGEMEGWCFDGFLSKRNPVKKERKDLDAVQKIKLEQFESFVAKKKSTLKQENSIEKTTVEVEQEVEEEMDKFPPSRQEQIQEEINIADTEPVVLVENLSAEQQLPEEGEDLVGDYVVATPKVSLTPEQEEGAKDINSMLSNDLDKLTSDMPANADPEKYMEFINQKIERHVAATGEKFDSSLIEMKHADLDEVKLPQPDAFDNIQSYKAKMAKDPKLSKLMHLVPSDNSYDSDNKVLIFPSTNIYDVFDVVKILFDLPKGLFIPEAKFNSKTIIQNPNKTSDFWFDQMTLIPNVEGDIREVHYNLRGTSKSFTIMMIRTNRTIRLHYRPY